MLTPGLRPRSIVGDDDTDERRNLRNWRSQGYGEVHGSAVDEGRTGHYTEAYLLSLASNDNAFVPTSFEDLRDDVNAGDLVDAFAGADGPILDYSPRERVIPEPPAPQPTGAERTPELSY